MKIILSRKGFDSGFGGIPSPILPNGEMLSLPIPDIQSDLKYIDLYISKNYNYEDLILELSGSKIKLESDGKYLIKEIGCHLDPDIRFETLKRDTNWIGLFGQSGAAQSHLRNQNVSTGDIFLFFGWFAPTHLVNGNLELKNRSGFHAIFGYLEIAEILELDTQDIPSWMQYHPHYKVRHKTMQNDTLYVASKVLSFNNNLKGYGTFEYKPKLKLTKKGYSRSKWNLPEFFKQTSISYHNEKSWKTDYFQSAAKGQEFVIEATDKILNWSKDIIMDSQFPIYREE
ncbi:MAG: hypothetical protein U9P73_08165 [Candidatus Cloacimonadota bacterium]|nr:hypothetical protein [Candidatus Cloacimonadota bacterium]